MVNEFSSSMPATGSPAASSDAARQQHSRKAEVQPAVSQAVQVEKTVGSSASVKATPSTEALSETVSRLNEVVQVVKRDLQFRVDDDSGRTVITVLDSETEEVIRQIPPERVLTLAKNIESLKGVLFTAEA